MAFRQGLMFKIRKELRLISPISGLRRHAMIQYLNIQTLHYSHNVQTNSPSVEIVKQTEAYREVDGRSSDKLKLVQSNATAQSLVSTSPTLRYLLAIGVHLSQLDKYEGAADMVNKLSLTKEIKLFVELCKSFGVEDIAAIINRYPLIVAESEEKLRHRVMYLTTHGFTNDQIVRIVTQYPRWLCQTVDQIDGKLGALQLLFRLNKKDMILFMSRHPRIIDAKPLNLKKVHFSLKEEYGLTVEEIKRVIHLSPSVIGTSPLSLKQRMDYLLESMMIPKERIVHFPPVLSHRVKRLKEKHELLKTLGRAQYNPTKPGFISLEDLCEDTTVEFCKRHQISEERYHDFLRTM